ncbi:MAG TPA: hypothetical protein VNY10_11770 [Roseiarcus sp.]|nr:hypothetical protein [Roseiarcus sp.]
MLDLDVLNPFILWPVGIALGGLLFFEVAKRTCRVDPMPRGVEARSKAIGPERLAANAPLHPARAPWPSRPAEAQRIFAGNARGWSIPLANVNPTRCEATVMVSIRVIGEDDTIVFASGQAEFDLDGMTLVTPLRPGAGYAEPFVTIIDPQEKVTTGVAGI